MPDEAAIQSRIHEATDEMTVPPRPELGEIEQRVIRRARIRRIEFGGVTASLVCIAVLAILIARPSFGSDPGLDVAATDTAPSSTTNGTQPAPPLPFPLDEGIEVGWLPQGYAIRLDERTNVPDRPIFTRDQAFTLNGLGLDEDSAPILIQVVEAPDVGDPSGDPQPSEVGNGTIYVDGPFSTGGEMPGASRVEFHVGDDIEVVVMGNQLSTEEAIRIAESLQLDIPACIDAGQVSISNPACAAAKEWSPEDRGYPAAHETSTTALPSEPLDPDGRFPGSIHMPDGYRLSDMPARSSTVTYTVDPDITRQRAEAQQAIVDAKPEDRPRAQANYESIMTDTASSPTVTVDEWTVRLESNDDRSSLPALDLTITLGDIYAEPFLFDPAGDSRISHTIVRDGRTAMVADLSTLSYLAWQERPGLSVFVASDDGAPALVREVAESLSF